MRATPIIAVLYRELDGIVIARRDNKLDFFFQNRPHGNRAGLVLFE